MQPLQCVLQHPVANLHLSTQMATKRVTPTMQPSQCDLQPQMQQAHRTVTILRQHPASSLPSVMQPLHCDLQSLPLVTTSLNHPSFVITLRHHFPPSSPFVITSLRHHPWFLTFTTLCSLLLFDTLLRYILLCDVLLCDVLLCDVLLCDVLSPLHHPSSNVLLCDVL